MLPNLSVSVDFNALAEQISGVRVTQLPFATALALTRTAQAVVPIERAEMEKVFDRPTPFTLNSLSVKPATKQTLEAQVIIKNDGLRLAQSHYLWPEILGGARITKRSELMLSQAGILPSGMFVVPGSGAKLDAFGNMGTGQIIQILSQLRAQGSAGFESRIGGKTFDKKKIARAVKKQGYRIFAIQTKVGKLPPGVYSRTDFAFGSAIKPLLIFVRQPIYKKRFDFFGVGNDAANRLFPAEFDKAMAEALATAR